MNTYHQWFRRVLALGMILNVGAIVGIFLFPRTLLTLLSIPEPPLIWLRSVGMLVTNVTISYIPALRDPVANRWVARYTVAPRLISAVFYFTEVFVFGWDRGFLTLGIFDLVFGVAQAALLYAASHSRPMIATPAHAE